MFFNGWSGIERILILGSSSYIALIVFLRLFGKRTLSKMNAFDLVVTVATGSILSIILLDKKVPLAEGITALLLLIILQYIIAWLSSRFQKVDTIVKSNPRLLYYNSRFLKDAMKKERITEMDILQAVRKYGYSSLEEVKLIVLEADGAISVLNTVPKKEDNAVKNIKDYPKN
ncbi:DUF421 domain-containing protein [Bacillus taeanensis]|uniref:DUF421 domain-containing protein n=1 Tax=Bacillus taeanensis TaxID=273032 RepID=A0A366XST5_9BACI|nr:YetF domain-containing protein [Bacillus taeanensis]RBW67809.1 DUF421 domain-containing protein [Bacillus taeanensis]